MSFVRNEKGSVLVFITLMIVLLMIMVGIGLDTGQLTYSRSMGQGAVDAAALAAVSGLPVSAAEVVSRATMFNPTKSNQTNNYVGSTANPIKAANVSYVNYDFSTNTITNYAATYGTANGVRVALETATGSAIATPAFLTPLLNLMGTSTAGSTNVNVSAVATITARPAIPIALWESQCNGSTPVPDVKIRQQNPQSGENSCWTTYLDPSSGASDVKALFKVASECSGSPINGFVDVGTPIYENKGQQASDYGDAYDFFFKNNTPGQWWLIPVITGSGNCNAKNPEKITDWAKIQVTDIDKGGSHSYIQANVVCNQTIHQPAGSSCFSHKLVREKTKGY
jgi:Flp pilus assembly protein TadG